MKQSFRFFQVLFLVLFSMGMFAQNFTEDVSVKFSGLPFQESWDQGTFTYNGWVLVPEYTNWSVNTSVGNPFPSADFSWEPVRTNYSLSLETPELFSGYLEYTTIWCDFDYKLENLNITGNEKLFLDVFHHGVWKNKAWFSNTASKDWTTMHVALIATSDTTFKVRFRAEGTNSADILHWYVDNISVYTKCNPPVDFALQEISDRQVSLTWNAPENGTGCPDPQWIHWDDGTNASAIGTCAPCFIDVAARWDAAQLGSLDGGAVTKIAFFPASSGTANFRIRLWQGPDAATLLVDQAVPTVTYGEWNIIDVTNPVSIDITSDLWIGYNAEFLGGFPLGCDAGPAVTGYGDMLNWANIWQSMHLAYGLDYNWNIQGFVETDADYATDIRSLMGYNLYRSEDNKITWDKLNNTLIADTIYTDHVPDYQEYCYYVTSVFPTYGSMTCESDSSNVVCADVVTGTDPLNRGGISIYPNPATDNLFVKSDFTINSIELLNYTGQAVYNHPNISEKTVQVNVANLTAGIYFVKITTVAGTKTIKITLTK